MASVSFTRRASLAALAGAALPRTSFAREDAVKWSEGTEKPRTAAPPGAIDCHLHTYDRRYKAIAGRVASAAQAEGLTYNVERISRQPNTLDCHRLILWARNTGDAGRMKQRLMELYFTEGADLTDREVLVNAAAWLRMCSSWLITSRSSSLRSADEAAVSGSGIVPPCLY